ncbi:MAG: hypothetical protein K9J16_15210 [Melioribacteraceae bacterium]|nr:hypothetical protein [Melioribacteraceae bacterium]MCF8353068.1 hypothetical protein [Melioribacteraceae bacterium]MCF8392786.1 hypothetical protein [Melioribacteraceae bacterium]MCF8418317.1 hypothetical protein [Melioribacteraceae bacterium]
MQYGNLNHIETVDIIRNKFPEINLENDSIISFVNTDDEYDSLKHGVGIRIHFDRAVYKLEGNDVLEFLNRISTNKTNNLRPLDKTNTLFLNEKGRIIDCTTLINFEGYQLLVGNSFFRSKLMSWINKFIITEDVKIEDQSSEYSIIELSGPQAKSYLNMLSERQIDSHNMNRVFPVMGDESNYFLYYNSHKVFGESYFLIFDSYNLEKMIDLIIESKSVFNLNFVGKNAWEKFRVEKGIPTVPNEINDQYNPHEVGLIDYVDFTKGCYIGQEVIARLDTYDKVQKKVYRLQFDLNSFEIPSSLINDNETVVGELTSRLYFNEIDKYLGLGLIKTKYVDPDGNILLKINDELHSVKVKEIT